MRSDPSIPALRLLSCAVLLLLLAACGTVRNTVTVPVDNKALPKQMLLMAVAVNSTAKNEDAQRYNQQLKALAQRQLIDAVRAKGGVWLSPPAKGPIVVTTIDADYGNRGLRLIPPLFRGNHGSGLIRVDIQLRAADGHVLYATHTEGTLKRGFLGGDILAVGERTVKQAVENFAARL